MTGKKKCGESVSKASSDKMAILKALKRGDKEIKAEKGSELKEVFKKVDEIIEMDNWKREKNQKKYLRKLKRL